MKRLFVIVIGFVSVLLVVVIIGRSARAGGEVSPMLGNPDLVVFTNAAPASATRGNSIAVSDVVSNQSSTASAGSSVTCMYLNTSLSLVGAANVGTHTTSGIGPKGKVSWSGNVTVPANQATGTNYFITVCDCQGNVNESNENNNTNSCVIVIN